MMDHFWGDDPLTVRLYNCMSNDKINSWCDVLDRGRSGMMRIPNFGRNSMRELEALMHRHGVSWREPPDKGPYIVYVRMTIEQIKTADLIAELARRYPTESDWCGEHEPRKSA